MRRCFAFLLILVCIAAQASCDAPPPLSSIATISQLDPAFSGSEYTYQNFQFMEIGCGPASVANALILSLGIDDPALAAGITLDTLQLLTNSDPGDHLAIERIAGLSSLYQLDQLPTLGKLILQWGGAFQYMDAPLAEMQLQWIIQDAAAIPQMVVTPVPGNAPWHFLYETAYRLYTGGQPDATISLALLGAGTENSDCAFRSGTAGHYVCLYVPVREFCEEGAIYVVDSLPRALMTEPFGSDRAQTPYQKPYIFNPMSTMSYKAQSFIDTCQVERISLTILRVSPRVPLDGYALADLDPYASAKAYDRYLDTIGFVNTGKAFVHIPAQQPASPTLIDE